MGSNGRLLFDLNEPPTDDEDGSNDTVFCFQPQRAIPSSSTATSDLFSVSTVPQGIVNNRAFSHAYSVSGFQPFVRHQIVTGSNHSVEERSSGNAPHKFTLLPEPSNGQDVNAVPNLQSGSAEAQAEKEEGGWSDAEGAVSTDRKILIPEESSIGSCKNLQEKGMLEITGSNDLVGEGNISLNSHDAKNENISSSVGLDNETNDKRSDIAMDAQEGSALKTKQREIRGVEANHALRYVNNLGKCPKLDQQKEAMLGKKRSRQTMFLNLEDVKQAGALKTSIPRRHIPAPTIIRTIKEGRATLPSSEQAQGDKQFQSINRDTKQSDVSSDGRNSLIESNDLKNEANGENNSTPLGRSRSSNSSTDLLSEVRVASVSRHGAWKSSADTRIVKSSLIPGRKPAISG